MGEESAAPAPSEWQSGWKLALACFFGFSFFSVLASSLGIFMEPLSQAFGWSRTLLSSGILLATVITALLSPPVGMLIDRFGSRRIALPGIVATSLALASFSMLNGSEIQWLLIWAIYAAIAVSVKTTVWTSAVAGVFDKSRGLALGIVLAGTAAAQTAVPPLANWLIELFGWRASYAILAFGWASITWVLCRCYLFDAHDRQSQQKAVSEPSGNSEKSTLPGTPQFPGLTIREAYRDKALWIISVATGLMMMLTVGLMVHQIPMLTAVGLNRTDAAWLASMAGIAAIAGKLATGFLLDRFRPNRVAGLTMAATFFAFILLYENMGSFLLLFFAMLVNGYTSGTTLQISGYLTVRYAGMKNFGLIFGVLTGITALASGMGPILAGLVFDLSGNYGIYLIAGAIGSLVCGFLLMCLPAYPVWQDEKDEPPLSLYSPASFSPDTLSKDNFSTEKQTG